MLPESPDLVSAAPPRSNADEKPDAEGEKLRGRYQRSVPFTRVALARLPAPASRKAVRNHQV